MTVMETGGADARAAGLRAPRVAEMRTVYPSTIWVCGCDSRYIGKDGLPALWPWTPQTHRAMLASPCQEEWEVQRR